MKKFFKWFFIILSILVVLGTGVTLFALNYIGNQVMSLGIDEALASIEQDIDAQASSTQSNGDVSTPQKPKITQEAIVAIKDKVTFKDKITVGAMVTKRLSASDISEVKSIVAGGITNEEKQAAKDIIYAKFTPEEVEKVKELYNKYARTIDN